MSIFVVPEWMAELDEEDVAFIRRFLLASGSLKEVAGEYGVSYPTVRLRLDPPHPENQAGRGPGRRSLCGAHQASGRQRQGGFRRRQDPHQRI